MSRLVGRLAISVTLLWIDPLLRWKGQLEVEIPAHTSSRSPCCVKLTDREKNSLAYPACSMQLQDCCRVGPFLHVSATALKGTFLWFCQGPPATVLPPRGDLGDCSAPSREAWRHGLHANCAEGGCSLFESLHTRLVSDHDNMIQYLWAQSPKQSCEVPPKFGSRSAGFMLFLSHPLQALPCRFEVSSASGALAEGENRLLSKAWG